MSASAMSVVIRGLYLGNLKNLYGKKLKMINRDSPSVEGSAVLSTSVTVQVLDCAQVV
jgi:hypothetical protein